MNAEQLKEILLRHTLWLKNPEEGCRANLIGANLIGAYLSGADLSGANLIGAYLSGADLREAKFTVELKDAVNLHAAVYYPQQFAFLALNPSFLESVQSFAGG